MPGVVVRSIFAFVVPGGLVLLTAVGFLRPGGLPPWMQQPVSAVPYIVLAFGFAFGWLLSSTRVLLSFLILALVDRALSAFSTTGVGPAAMSHPIFAVTAFLLPLNLLALSLLKEEIAPLLRAAGYVILVLAESFVVLWLCHPERSDIAAAFQQALVSRLTAEWTPIPQPALLAFGVAAAIQLVRFVLRRDPLEAGSFWTLAAIFVAYHGERYGWHPTNFFAAGGLTLFLGLLQSAYQRTYRDELTGIAGRTAYDEAIGQLGKRFSLAVLAVDQLKFHTNVHGKTVGEQILRLIAPKVQASCRGGRVFRVSGEELTLLFPNHSAVETLAALETLRKMVESTSLILCGRDRVREDARERSKMGATDCRLPVTVSAGVAEKVEDIASVGLVLKAAYRALYEAKLTGGNVVKRGSVASEPARRSSSNSGRIVASGEYS